MGRRNSESLKTLSTKAEVLDALGGLHCVAAITGADWKNVEMWKRAKAFPARYFLVMTWALKKKRLAAPPSLWGMVVTADMDEVAA